MVVALDNINTPAEIAWRVKDIATHFVDRMGPADDLSVITLANDSPFGSHDRRDAGTYYLLGYRTPINDHRLHDIASKVRRDGRTLRARRARG